MIVSRKAAPNLAKWNKKAKELRSANPAPAPPPTAAATAAPAATSKPAPTASTLTSQTVLCSSTVHILAFLRIEIDPLLSLPLWPTLLYSPSHRNKNRSRPPLRAPLPARPLPALLRRVLSPSRSLLSTIPSLCTATRSRSSACCASGNSKPLTNCASTTSYRNCTRHIFSQPPQKRCISTPFSLANFPLFSCSPVLHHRHAMYRGENRPT